MSDPAQLVDPQQEVSIQSIIAQDAPGKESEEAAGVLAQSLAGMSNEDLLALLEAAYREDPESNSVVLQEATRILGERGQGDQVKNKVRAIRSESWRGLLGEWLGGELYDVISDQTHEEALMEAGKEALKGAAEGSVDFLAGLDGLTADGSEAIKKFATELSKTAILEGNKFLESEAGQRLVGRISRWVDKNPGYVVAIAVLAAAGAIAADVDIPEIEQDFKLGDNFSGEAAIDLGSLRNIAIEAARLNMQYVSGQFKATAGVAYEQDEGVSGEASLRYGDKEDFIQTTGTIDPEGNLVLGLEAAMKAGLFSSSLKGQHDFGQDATTGQFKLRYGNEERFIGSDFTLSSDNNVTIGLDSGFRQGLFSSTLGAGYDPSKEDPYSANANLRYGTERNFGNLGASYAGGQLSGAFTSLTQLGDDAAFDSRLSYDDGQLSSETGLTRTFDGGHMRTSLGAGDNGVYQGLDLSYKPSDALSLGLSARDEGLDETFETISLDMGLKPSELAAISLKLGRDANGESADLDLSYGSDRLRGTLGYELKGGEHRASAGGSFQNGHWSGSADATFNINDSELEQLSLRLGFRHPEEFEAFSAEFSRSVSDGVTEHRIGAMFETQLGQYMLRGTGSASFTQDNTTVDAELLGARFVSDNTALIAGGSYRYDEFSGTSAITPKIGVQHNGIPLTIGYDFASEAVTVGITIPFGR